MRGSAEARAGSSDQELIEQARAGDDLAFAALWSRHRLGALAAARSFTDLDAEDLVSEAYTAILERFRRGGGPEVEAFRPYLYTVVRNLARRRGAAQREVNVEELPELVGDDMVLDGQVGSLEQRMIRDAFRSLPARWREVLWYAEVERLSPAEIAPMLGLGANATAALAYRAREGLRQAWLQAHVADAQREGECGWVLAHIGEHSRDRLSKRAGTRIDAHLARCRACRDVALEVGHVNRQLASILAPTAIGGATAAAWWVSAAPAPASAAVIAATGGGASVLGGVAAAVAGVGLLGGLVVLGPTGSASAPAAGSPVDAAAVQPIAEAGSASAPAEFAPLGPPPDVPEVLPAGRAMRPAEDLAGAWARGSQAFSAAAEQTAAGIGAAVDGTLGAVTGSVPAVVDRTDDLASSLTGGTVGLQAEDGRLSAGVDGLLSISLDGTGFLDILGGR